MIPLSLYIHIPWCVLKCPYCDFNSHQQKGTIPEDEYIAHLLNDLEQEAVKAIYRGSPRTVQSIFIGGGTPSLLSVDAMHHLLQGVRKRIPLADDAEITMEANPGTVEADKFVGFTQAGVNRISIGVQSFDHQRLGDLGRIHDGEQAERAISIAKEIPLRSFNTDIMHGLPNQQTADALADLQKCIDQQAPHISWYQLTIEPQTQFYSKPPKLPNDDILWDIQCQGQALLAEHGYQQYEVSAYAKPNHQCQHNLNYWQFGDYIGIGCGAHGKLTNLETYEITRTVKVKHPRGYMDMCKQYTSEQTQVLPQDMPFEFFMNRFRLLQPCVKSDYEIYTGTKLSSTALKALEKLEQQGLIEISESDWVVTKLGRRYLNSVLECFV